MVSKKSTKKTTKKATKKTSSKKEIVAQKPKPLARKVSKTMQLVIERDIAICKLL